MILKALKPINVHLISSYKKNHPLTHFTQLIYYIIEYNNSEYITFYVGK